MKAPDILRKSISHMEQRAASRDQAEGERSMARTVQAFNALTGHSLTERDGWVFMVQLKMARACTTQVGVPDDYEDGAAYVALAGESVAQPVNDNAVPVVPGALNLVVLIEGVGAVTIPPGFKWIARDLNGALWAYANKPSRGEEVWWAAGRIIKLTGKVSEKITWWADTLRQVRE